jgi:hypothetical protein
MEIDLNYYVKNAIVGIFARFIAYHPQFQPPEGMYNPADKEQYKQMDKHCVDAASKYLEELCDSITGHDPTAVTLRGREYRKVYNRTEKLVQTDLAKRYGGAAEMLYDVDVHDSADDNRARSTRIIEQIRERAKAQIAESESGASYSDAYLRKMAELGYTPFRLKRIFTTDKSAGLVKKLMEVYKSRENAVVASLVASLGSTSRIIYSYEQRFIQLIDELRSEGIAEPTPEQIERVNTLDEDSQTNIQKITELSNELSAIMLLQERLKGLVGKIESERMKTIGEPLDPKVNARDIALKESKEGAIIDPYQW